MSLSIAHTHKSTIDRANLIRNLMGGLSAVAPGLVAKAAEQLFVTVVQHKRPRREEAWAEGATRISIPSQHGELAAWVWADGPKTVLLVHGWAGRGLQLGAFVEPLVGAGYRVVACDGPAHGESPGRRTNIFSLTEGLGHRRILRDPGVVTAVTEYLIHREALTEEDPSSLNNAASAA